MDSSLHFSFVQKFLGFCSLFDICEQISFKKLFLVEYKYAPLLFFLNSFFVFLSEYVISVDRIFVLSADN